METSSPPYVLRSAIARDLSQIVALLIDDPLGQQRETKPDAQSRYQAAFQAIEADPNNTLLVAAVEQKVIGVLQLTLIPNLTYQGSWRAMIEGVRVARAWRSQGIGQKMMQWAVNHAKARHCRLLQLTTDKARPQALTFYQRLGFIASHEGMKLHLQ